MKYDVLQDFSTASEINNNIYHLACFGLNFSTEYDFFLSANVNLNSLKFNVLNFTVKYLFLLSTIVELVQNYLR